MSVSKKVLLVLACILSGSCIPSVSSAQENSSYLTNPSCQDQVQTCRNNLLELTSSNPKVMRMFDETVAQWKDYWMQNNDFDFPLLIQAISFAATKHQGQFRKDAAATPYIIHPIGVARSLWEEGKVRNLNVLLAALLHDTLEDTETSSEELGKLFGSRVSSTVEELTNDPNLSTEQNKQRQIDHACMLSLNAQLVKLADRLYNVRDLRNLPSNWGKEKVRSYLMWGEKLLKALKGTNQPLEELLGKEIAEQRSAL
jgi:hypothetical protein